MRARRITSFLLIAASCLVGHLGRAQQVPVALLAPVVASPRSTLSVESQPKSSAIPSSFSRYSPWARRVSQLSEPIYLINSRIIISELGALNAQNIKDIRVYKGSDAPVQWRSLTERGIVDIKFEAGVKPRLKTESLAAIRRQAKASGVVSFQLNGMRLDDTSLRVATADIAGLDFLRSDSGTVINIRLAPPKSSPPAPPGTIYIRGVARQ